MWIVFVISVVCLLQVGVDSATTKLKTGDVAYTVEQISSDKYNVDATDGQYIWKATTSKMLDDMVYCHLYHYPSKAAQLLQTDSITVENIGLEKIKLMKKKCRVYHDTARRATSKDDNDTFNHDLAKTMPFSGDFETGAPSGAGSHFAIFPGTKWCGFQNVANNMQDLGVHNETDSCCRTHDHCPYYIDRFETKYHYFNHDPWTLSHCDCDQHLFDCLKKVNNPTSNTVGNLFFGVLDVQCFKFSAGEYCSDTSILSHLWCSKKNKGTMAVMQEFPHKWGEDKPNESASDSDSLVG